MGSSVASTLKTQLVFLWVYILLAKNIFVGSVYFLLYHILITVIIRVLFLAAFCQLIFSNAYQSYLSILQFMLLLWEFSFPKVTILLFFAFPMWIFALYKCRFFTVILMYSLDFLCELSKVLRIDFQRRVISTATLLCNKFYMFIVEPCTALCIKKLRTP